MKKVAHLMVWWAVAAIILMSELPRVTTNPVLAADISLADLNLSSGDLSRLSARSGLTDLDLLTFGGSLGRGGDSDVERSITRPKIRVPMPRGPVRS